MDREKPSRQKKRPWRKILYERQPYPDNYIDSKKFLDELNMGSEQHVVSYLQLVISTSFLVQQLTIMTTFLGLYLYVVSKPQKLTMNQLYLIDFGAICTGLFINRILDDEREIRSFTVESVRLVFIFCVCLRVSAPILQTLTSSFSEDTIHALALILAATHLVFYDYTYMYKDDQESFSGTLSLNAAMFTAVLLASRLQDVHTVVAFVLLAVICFSLYPSTARLVNKRSLWFHLLLTILQWVATGVLLAKLDSALYIYEIATIFLFFFIKKTESG